MRYPVCMSYRDDEKRWKRIQDMLAAEASGKTLRPVVSQRTLFGIPSSVDVAIQRIVAEDEEARRAKRKQAAALDDDGQAAASDDVGQTAGPDDEPAH